ncbi:translocation/assembly module TamB domain-containing protein [Hansschlegelia sp. KR7-227]|uniref:translocation/assembly module TamB domain-containing protein n=1 Tax=Hansschlegelia sp. KR7-227 TaxID=3400914 RepID=UPI003C05E6A2
MAILKRALIVLGVLLLIPVVVLAAVLFYLTTAPGLATIASLTSKYASSDSTKITIGGIEGSFPYDLTLRDVRLSDPKGEWATIDRARVEWSPLQLYQRRLTIDLVDLGRVAIARPPEYPESDEPTPAPDPNAPLFPELPIEIRLDKFMLADLDLAEPVIGAPARLSATASALVRKPAEGISAEFDVRRIDGQDGRFAGKAQFVPATNAVQISLRGGEPAGGLIARVAQLPGLPPIDLGLEGSGTLDALRAQLVLTAGDQGRIDGVFDVRREQKTRRIKLMLDGDVAGLAPPQFAELAAGKTKVAAEAVVPDEGPIDLIDATVDAAAARLGVRGKIDTAKETVDLAYDLRAGDAARFAGVLPPGSSWASLTVLGTAKGPLDHPAVNATIDGGGLAAPQGGAETARVILSATPNGPLMDETTQVAAVVDATAEGVKFADDRLFTLGRSFSLSAAATSNLKGYADIERAEVKLADVRATYAGTASPEAAKGKATVSAGDLSTLAPLVGRPLAGSIDLASDLDVVFDLSRVVVSANGSGSGLVTGVPQVDALTGGDLTIKGGVTRGADGAFAFQGLDLRGDHVTVTADGVATRERADAKITAEVEDLALVDPRAGGKATVNADLSGRLDDLALKAVVSLPEGRALDRKLEGVEINVDATDVTGDVSGTVEVAGSLDGKPVKGSAKLVTEITGVRRIQGLDLDVASAKASGDVSVTPDGLATGKLAVAAPDLSEVGALALTQLAGSLDADIDLSVQNGVQRAVVKASGANVTAPGAKIGSIEVAATVVDPTGKITIDGTANGSAIAAGGQVIDRLAMVAKGAPDGMDVTLDLGAQGSSVSTDARVAYAPNETRIDLARLDITGGGRKAALAAPARLRVIGSEVAIDAFSLRSDQGGVLNVTGRAGEQLDLTVGLRELPLALGNAFTPGLGLGGMAQGDARVTGPAAAPNAVFDLSVADLSIAQFRDAKVPPLTLAAKGRLEGQRVVADASVTGAGGLEMTAQGSAPLGEGDLDMTVGLKSVPLALANAFQPDLGLGGRLAGDVRITGPIARPRGTYAARVVDFTSAKARSVPAITIDAKGELLGDRVTTDTTLSGGGGIGLVARGSAPLSKGDVDMSVAIKELPLALANAFAPELGLGGDLRGDVRLSGPIDAPRGNYNLRVTNLVAAQAKALGAIQIDARGALEGPRVTTLTNVTGGGGLNIRAEGFAPLGDGDLGMDVTIREVPLKIANAFMPELGLGGELKGAVRLTGSAKAPSGTYDLTVSDLTSAQARGVPALLVVARGELQPKRVTTDAVISGGGGIQATAKGSAPIGEGDVDMTIGLKEFPLALANVAAPELGLDGVARGQAQVSGPVTRPRGTYDLVVAGLKTAKARDLPALEVAARGTLEGDRATTDATITGGGGLSVVAKGSAPLGDGDLDMTVSIRDLPLKIANSVRPDLGLDGSLRGDVKATGPIKAPVGTYDVEITGLVAAAAKGVPPLRVIARGDLQGDRVTTDTSITGAGGINVAARGSAPLGQGDLNMLVTIRGLPLAIANGVKPELGLGGTLRGDVKLTGPATKPVGSYDVTVADLVAAPAKGVPPLQVAAKGELLGDRATTDTVITGEGGISLTAKGSAPIGDGDLDMAVAIRQLPLALANGVKPELGLGGTLRGDVRINGPVTRPLGAYNLTVTDLTAAQAKGVPPLQVATRGDLLGERVTTDTTVTGQGRVSLTAKGSAPIGDGDLDMAVAIRELPLALANGFKPELGLGGTLRGDAKVAGPIAAPRGTYDVTVVDLVAAPAKGVPALKITSRGALEGERVTTDTEISGGGGVSLTAKGSAPIGQGPVDMTVAIREIPLALANAFQPSLGLGGVLRGDAKVGGTISAPQGTYDLTIANLTSAQAKGVQPLQIATRGTLEGGRVTTATALTGGGGVRLTAKGVVPLDSGAMDMTVDIAELPLAIANGFSPGLGLGGKLAGGAKVAGPLSAPAGTYDLRVTGLTSAMAKGVPAIQITAKGALGGGRVTTDTAVSGGGGLRITAKGSGPMSASGALDVAVDINAVPLALANGFSPGLGANGALSGDAKVGGTIAAPSGTYNLRVVNLSTAATRAAGVPAAQINSKGRIENLRVVTDTVVTGAGGLRVNARGSAPLGAGNLDLSVDGRAPLGFLNDTLSVSGDRIDGAATFDVKVGGPVSAPRIEGRAQLANASYSNRASGLQLRAINAAIAANGTKINVTSLRATTRNGGTITGSGQVDVNPAAGFPGQINFRAQNAEVMGTDVVTAITDADLRLQGPLARRPVITGTINTRSIEVQIPDRIPAAYTPLPNVRHRNAPPQIARQANAVNAGKAKGGSKEDAFLATLDIDVRADNRIFIRGMGMQAEAGGQIKITGTSANPVPIGGFQLRPGRSAITVIGKKLDFTRGELSFAGDLDPTLDFLAETKAKDITAQVIVTGTASRPKIEFGSNPQVPPDEVLSRLLFNKASGELSPTQALTLAQAVAQYSGVGGGGGGPLEGLRKGLGVDSLDIAAGGEGGPGLGVGRYISDNIYLGFRQGTTPESTNVTVDVDITDNIKAQAEAGAAGNTSAGVAVEWDY